MNKFWKILLTIGVLATLFRFSPIPQQVNENMQPTRVVVQSEWQVEYRTEDGSFALGLFAGCLPWKSCGINEPTDWWVGER